MAIYHCSIQIISRSAGRSAVAAASYRSGTILHELETGEVYDFTHKMEVVYSEIDLPPQAPPDYFDREKLWNAVHEVEKNKNAQLAREIEVALPIEFSRERQIEVVRDYVQGNFVDKGMCVDWSIHDKGTGNPHAHIMLTMRPIDENGKWMPKERKTYALDENGERIPQIDKKTGAQKLGKRNEKLWKRITVQANDWNDKSKAEEWRAAWAEVCNRNLAPELQIDHRSYERQGKEKEPTIHEGYQARQMEKDGVPSCRCEYNRTVRALNHAKKHWQELIEELQKSILQKGCELIGRINERVRGYDEHIEKPREAVSDYRGTAERDRQPQTAERGIDKTAEQIKEKERKIHGRIENLLQRRGSRTASFSSGGIAERERLVDRTDRGLAEGKQPTDTAAFLRDARADVADLIDALGDSRNKTSAATARRRDRELKREVREERRERSYLERELRAQRARARSFDIDR